MEDQQGVFERIRLDCYAVMARHGYLDRVRRHGAELDRWRQYLERLGRPGRPEPADPLAQPNIFPMMDGLDSSPWRDAGQAAASAILETSCAKIRQQLEAVDRSEFILYDSLILASGGWTVLPVFLFGEETGVFLSKRNPLAETARLIRGLPDVCATLPLADAIFSAHAPHTRLAPHCSWDPFRLRLHLGVRIPPRCGIRVGRESRFWSEGQVLAFHDSYEHETWNGSDEPRIVLIVDLWHPELTAPERRAILACFRKKEIRGALMRTRAPAALQPTFYRRFADVERNDPLVAEFWCV